MNKNIDEYGKGNIDTDPVIYHGGRGKFSLRGQTFSSLKNPVFRLLFGSTLGQRGAMNMQMMARSLLIYRVTGSAAILGVMSLANALPQMFFALFGGVIADRVQKKYALLAGQASSAVVALAIAFTLTTGYLSAENTGSWWILIAASILNGTIQGLMIPSRQAIIYEIVNGEQLMNAVALNAMGMNVLRLLAPAAAGFLIDAFDFAAVYYAMTGMYLFAVVCILLMPLTSTMTIRGSGALSEIKKGFQYIRCEPTILLILAFTLLIVLLSMPYIRLLPVFSEDILKVGARGLGVLLSISAVGAIAGSLFLASLPNKKRGLMLILSALITGIALIGFSFSGSWYISLGLIVFIGLGQAGRMTLGNTLIQYYVENEYRGRVMAIYMMEFGMTGFSSFAAGLLTEAIGIQWSVGGFAVILVIIALLTLVFIPRIRRLD
ncbi:MFS transporter [Chloroflexota bacterium]